MGLWMPPEPTGLQTAMMKIFLSLRVHRSDCLHGRIAPILIQSAWNVGGDLTFAPSACRELVFASCRGASETA